MTRRNEIPIALWKRIEPLIPQVKPSPKGGRPRLSDQQALNGIVYVLRTGIAWEDLPLELGYGSGMTCWRRLRDWQANGVWHRLHQVLLAEPTSRRQTGSEPSKSGRRQRGLPPGGPYTGPNPTDRGKLGSKRHVIVDRNGVPLAVCVTGANRHDSVAFEEVLDALPAIGGKPGRARRWPGKLHADKAYDIDRCRNALKQRGITARIARKGIERNDRLGQHRWVVERTHAWFAAMGKLRIRFERRIDIHLALLSLACSIICLRMLPGFC
ncbi:IS5 family transposase (plasmid) [Xanthomonas axonopodis pv. vasculorum]